MKLFRFFMIFVITLALAGCLSSSKETEPETPESVQVGKWNIPLMDFSDEPEHVIYLAGGCFWGIEYLMETMPGVIDVKSGYANGRGEKWAKYDTILETDTAFRETVRVVYDPEKTSTEALLLAYFSVIDPTVQNRQGWDFGYQYQTGIYYTNDKIKETIERIAAIERSYVTDFYVEIGPLLNFFDAEDDHQNYLANNPNGYCHIPLEEIEFFSTFRLNPKDYTKPAKEILREQLSDMHTETEIDKAFIDLIEGES